MLQLRPLTLANFADYETLTARGDDGKVCYCSFWHLKCRSVAEYDAKKAADPLALREVVRSRVVAGFHVGALAYEGDTLATWISVGPLPEVYWAWKRTVAVGVPEAARTACITCFVVAPAFRGKGTQQAVATALVAYGREQGWTAIEAYPFDEEAARSKPLLAWPGYEAAYRAAGFTRVGDHWLSSPPEHTRWIYRATVT